MANNGKSAAKVKQSPPVVDLSHASLGATSTLAAGGSESAQLAGLVYVSDAAPGIRRRSFGTRFRYIAPNGKRIADTATLNRIQNLAIPPAYTDVWICVDARGHLQATGRDARRRKQYRYHSRWRVTRDEGKFGKLIEFGERLPRLRRRIRRDLILEGLPREKILAVIISLLAETMIRIGNEEYAINNGSFGLTTLQTRHVAFLKGRAMFRFRGKSGQQQEVAVTNTRLVRLLRRCQQLPGQSLFQYVDDSDTRQPIDSGMVNDYLQDAMSEHFTAKDFRTWGGSIRAIAALALTPVPESRQEHLLASAIASAVKIVASELRNTPAVCRNSYIHPEVFAGWRDGTLHRLIPAAAASKARVLEVLSLRFLRTRFRCSKSKAAGSPKAAG
jgi:DNA topoisomerase-1